jgi:hypothetical protein
MRSKEIKTSMKEPRFFGVADGESFMEMDIALEGKGDDWA